MSSRPSPTYDVVVWGASGFTGGLVVEYLLERYGLAAELNWAIAGRDLKKLEALRQSFGEAARGLPILIANAHDEASLEAIAGKTRVLCSTVGPYAKYGGALVAACAKAGVDYCDLAGEPHFIRRMIDEHGETAMVSGARIVCACGFDSIPSDLGVYFLNRHAQERFGEACHDVRLRVIKMDGGVSGGTAASMLGVVAAARADHRIAELLEDPYSLNPPNERRGMDGPDRRGVSYDADLGMWLCPFVMAGINTRVVRRSHALMGYPYGRDFRYEEATAVGSGLFGGVKACLTAFGLAAFFVLAAFSLTRRGLRWALPKPGEGPSKAEREAGGFQILLVGKAPSGRTLRAEVGANRDPGYGATSRMLAEAAVCLATSHDGNATGGVLTPASAMAEPLLLRLKDHAGLTFRICDPEPLLSQTSHTSGGP